MSLKLAYIGLTFLTVIYLITIGCVAINATSKNRKKDKYILIVSLFIWHVYILALSSTNLLKSYEFPPLFAIAFILPSFIFTGIFLYLNRNKQWIQRIPEQWITYFQTFRVFVETLFVLSVSQGILNYHVSIEGYNFDMIFALTAPIISFLVYNKNVLPRRMILLWNYLGLAVLASVIFVFITCIYQPQIYGSTLPLLPLDAMGYPYILIAGFLMPTAVFLHILSILQLKKRIN